MAVLSVQDRTRVWRGLMRRWSADGVTAPFSKYDLYNPNTNTGAVADTDQWIDTHQGTTSPDTVGYNGSLSVPMRTALSLNMKTDLFLAVAAMRRGLAYVRSIFGEVD